MERGVFKKNPFHALVVGVAPLAFTAIIIVALLFGFRQAEDASRAEGVRLLEESLIRVVIHSYSVNGHFPESLEYIETNYNIFIDRTRFLVHYDVFASNMLPDIIVHELQRPVN